MYRAQVARRNLLGVSTWLNPVPADERESVFEMSARRATDALASQTFCYVTTKGRRTGRPHVIEIWFELGEGGIYLLSGGGAESDWVRNLVADPAVTVRIGDETFEGRARVVEDPEEDAMARRLLATKYQGWHPGEELSTWARTALPVAIDLQGLS
jgi:deazaflavin-dependent oxidoreductase (nitroreductase family)